MINRILIVSVGLIALISLITAVSAYAQPIPVNDTHCTPFSTLPQVYSYNHQDTGWMGVAVVSETGQNVFLGTYDNAAGVDPAFNTSEMPGETNFLVHQWTTSSQVSYFKTYTDAGPFNYQHLVDYDPGQGAISFGVEYSGNYGSVGYDCGLMRVWDANLEAGNTYEINLDSDAPSGYQEIRAALIQTGGSNGWQSRADAIWDISARENTYDDGHSFSVPTSGSYALVVFHNGYHNLDVIDSDYHFKLIDHGGSVETYVDLEVLSIYPGNSAENLPFDLGITIRNNGTARSTACVTNIWAGSALVCSELETPAIDPGQSVDLAACPVGPYPTGSIEVLAQVDYNDVVDESLENNNQKSRTIAITASKPDLRIASVSPTFAVPYNTVDFAIEVVNIGLGDAAASETSFNIDFTNPCGNIPTPPIPSGGSATVYCEMASLTPGAHVIGSSADISELVDEQVESNNSINTHITAQGPDLVLVDLNPTEVSNEDSFSFIFTVANEGTTDMPACFVSISSNGAELLAPFVMPIVPQGQQLVVTSPTVAPLGRGTVPVTICVDSNNSVAEYYKTNNCLTQDLDVLVSQTTVFPDGHGDFPSIQAAVNGVVTGGFVYLAEGEFFGPGNRDITFNGKNVSVIGTGTTPNECTINCEGSSTENHRGFVFENGESYDAVLSNITITAGWVNDGGGAIQIDAANPTLQNLTFNNNRSNLVHGGAIYSTGSSFILNDCLFDGNRTTGEPPVIIARGGAVYCTGTSFTVRINGNTFINNIADEAAALGISSGVALITNSLFVDNDAMQGTINGWASAVVDFDCCNIWGNGGGDWTGFIAGLDAYDGNLSTDPLFCDFSNSNYSLHANSPCAAENNDCGQVGVLGVGCAPSGQSVYQLAADGSGDYATIQAAINSAQSGDVIELADGVYAGSGNRDLHFDGKDLIFRSTTESAADCIIDCGGSSGSHHRAFLFNNSGESKAARIENITIRYGYATSGGGVSIIGADPTFIGCVFYVNSASSLGGGVYAQNANCRFESCDFGLNHADTSGAAAYLDDGSYTLDRCTLSSNSASANGGGVMLVNCTDSFVDQCVMYSNTAGTAGGAINVVASQVTVEACTIDENIANTGAGIACDASTMIQIGSTCITRGYGAEGLASAQYTNLAVGCTNIWGNAGGDWVGYIAGQSENYGNLSVDPMYCDPGLGNFHLNLLSPVSDENNTCGQVGALAVGCGIQTFVIFADGSGDYPTIQAALDASAWGDTISLASGVFVGDGNRDLHFDGKAVTLRSLSGNPEQCIIDCNGSATTIHRGIDISSGDGPGVRIVGLTIRNAWRNYGGAIRMAGGNPTIDNCIFESNTSNNGAAIATANGATPLISNCLFRNNNATNAGGAIHAMSGASPILTDCVFSDNFATWGGGGVYVYSPAAPSFSNCLFNNNGSDHYGGVYHTQNADASIQFDFCTFFANYSPDGGVGYCRNESSVTLDNSILSGSTSGEAVYCGSGGTTRATNCDVWENAGGDWVSGLAGQGSTSGNLNLDPQYCDTAAGLFSLFAGSPCSAPETVSGNQMGAYVVGCSDGARLLEVFADGSGNYSTIQAAVNASYHGDTVVLADGVYTGDGNRDVNLLGKQITVKSDSENALACIIDCLGSSSAPRRAFLIESGEGPNTVICHLTITNGWRANGAGILVNGSSPTISSCRFINNEATNGGGILANSSASPNISDCYFFENSASNAGAGLRYTGSSGLVDRCHFENNFGYWGGGGIYIYLSAVSVTECLFVNNSCTNYGSDLEIQAPDKTVAIEGCTFVGGSAADAAVRLRQGSVPTFSRCLFAFTQQGKAIVPDASSSIVISCSNIFGNAGGDWVDDLAEFAGISGNVGSDPLFCDFAAGDYQVGSASACLPAGNTCGQQIGAFGESCRTTPVNEGQLPAVVTLQQNYPNPFNPSTNISFELPNNTFTKLQVFDMRGRLVKNLLSDNMKPGAHSVVWHGDDDQQRQVSAGVYWYRLQTDQTTSTRKMMLLK